MLQCLQYFSRKFMQVISESFLSLGLEDFAQISIAQLILLDVTEEQKGLWLDHVLGKSISDARAELFVLLKGINDKADQDRVIENYKALQNFRKNLPKQELQKEKEKKPTAGDVIIYCDGGCSPNPGASGSGIAVYRNGIVDELWYGLYEHMGTNNTAELNALYQSLLIAQKESEVGNKVEIKCDSMYSINCIKTWAISWEKKGWTKKGGEIKNLEIIQKSYTLYNQLKSKVELSHIKAHIGLEGNELADRMTVHAREEKNPAFVQYEDPINIDEILSMRAG